MSLHVGLVDLSSSGWSAGASYTRMLASSLAQACRNADSTLSLLSASGGSGILNDASVRVVTWRDERPRRFRGEGRLRRLLRLSARPDPFVTAAQNVGISTLLPLVHIPEEMCGVGTIGWIPDFQHVYLPGYFSEEDRRLRDAAFLSLVTRADLVMLSSRAAAAHYANFAPTYAHKARVLPFPSLLAFDPVSGDPRETLARFHLPSKFALVANQFWQHKNHLAVVEAVRQLQAAGLDVPVVMTGRPADFRDPRNRTVSSVLQAIAAASLGGQVVVLGEVDSEDLLQLMRAATVIIQPSRFEGWSTVIEDGKALGRPLVCSDIPVNREQAPDALGFFPCDEPERLAELLAERWSDLQPGPDTQREQMALEREREFALQHGQQLLGVCSEAGGRANA